MRSKLTYINLIRYMYDLCESSPQYEDCKKAKLANIYGGYPRTDRAQV